MYAVIWIFSSEERYSLDKTETYKTVCDMKEAGRNPPANTSLITVDPLIDYCHLLAVRLSLKAI